MVSRPDSRTAPAHARPAAVSTPRAASTGKKARSSRKARAVLERPPQLGWLTSDEDEIALRRWRGTTEIVTIEPLEPAQPVFGTFRAQSGSGAFYEVEIRSVDDFANSC